VRKAADLEKQVCATPHAVILPQMGGIADFRLAILDCRLPIESRGGEASP
jgi:hypothetical protein